MNMNKLFKMCMMVGVLAIVFGMYASSSYAQVNSCVSNTVYCDESTGYQIGTSGYVLWLPNGTTNLSVGVDALGSLNTSFYNTGIGSLALENNSTGEFNTATGNSALEDNESGSHNTADGTDALVSNIKGGDNTAMGYATLEVSTASGNTGIGELALRNNTSGGNNTALGTQACFNVT